MAADGTWNVVMKTQMGDQPSTLTLKTDGDTLTGTMAGGQMGSLDLKDGKVDGDKLSWKAELTQPMALTLTFTATIDGDSISGDVGLGTYGNATFSGTRA